MGSSSNLAVPCNCPSTKQATQTMRLDSEEAAILAGEGGPAAQTALAYQIKVGDFFGAQDFVPIRSAHLAADAESLRDFGVAHLSSLADQSARFRVFTTINAGAADLDRPGAIGQREVWHTRTEGICQSLARMGAHMCLTCVNYQLLDQPHLSEPLAWGDTGTVIWANSICGARSNFEAGPAALSAGLTGRTPRYGMHLDERRRASVLVKVTARPRGRAQWSALGGLIGRQLNDYWKIPCLVGDPGRPSPDELKFLGAALASFGSTPMFHWVGMTPEAPSVAAAFGGRQPERTVLIDDRSVAAFINEFQPQKRSVDVVAFSAPQLSPPEIGDLADRFAGQKVASDVLCLITTSPMARLEAGRLGHAATLESAGVELVAGTCFYVMAPHELLRDRKVRTLVTDSAKLANIIPGYGYQPALRDTAQCVDAAISGVLP